jgi:hypothetical protein
MPWFQAKPVSTYLEYAQVTRALDHVDKDDKLSLDELVETNGPVRGESFGWPQLTGWRHLTLCVPWPSAAAPQTVNGGIPYVSRPFRAARE